MKFKFNQMITNLIITMHFTYLPIFTDNRQRWEMLTDYRQSNWILTDNRQVTSPPHSDPPINWNEVKAGFNEFYLGMHLLDYFHDDGPQVNPNPFRPKSVWTSPPHREIAFGTFLEAIEQDVSGLREYCVIRDWVLSIIVKGEDTKLKSMNCEWFACRDAWTLKSFIRYSWFSSNFFRENRASTEDKFYSEARGPLNELFEKVLKDLKAG